MVAEDEEDEEGKGVEFKQVVQQRVCHGDTLEISANIRWYLEKTFTE